MTALHGPLSAEAGLQWVDEVKAQLGAPVARQLRSEETVEQK